jgi:hypothetical protein
MRKISGIISIFLLILIPISLLSLTLAKASLEELTRESELVIRGTVRSVQSDWESGERQAIHTNIEVTVEQYLKGNGKAEVVVRQLGGQVGDIRQVIAGSPQFQVGEEVILFLVKHDKHYRIHSIALGSFRIVSGEDQQKLVMNDLRNVNLIDPDTGLEIIRKDPLQFFSLQSFVETVQSYVSTE